jgi:hypothetical protein
MPFTVSADPLVVFVDAIKTRLEADTLLDALITGVYGHLSEATRTAYPYVVLGRRSVPESAGAMGTAGQIVELQIDVWSDAKGPYTVTTICSAIYRLLERWTPALSAFDVVEGSLTRAFQDIFDEPDEDNLEQTIYHGVQRWRAEIHER